MRQYSRRTGLALALAAGIAAAPVPALASGFQLIEQNGSGLGNAYAGQAAGVRDPSAILFNPAALTRLKGKHILARLERRRHRERVHRQRFHGAGTLRNPGRRRRRPGRLGSGAERLPLLGGRPAFWVGVGVNAPFGLKTEWDSDWMGRFHGIKSDLKTYNIAPTIAFKVNDNLSIGAGASIQRLSANLTKCVAYGAIGYGRPRPRWHKLGLGAYVPTFAAANAAVLGKRRPAVIDGNKWGYRLQRRRSAQPERGNTHIGLNYRSKTKYTLDGTATFSARPTFVGPGPLAAVATAVNAGFARPSPTVR